MPESVTSGTIIGGRYRLVREVARGGMATVWEADDAVLSRRVAVKILDSSLCVDDAVRTRFRHEAVAAARLSHPGIVATFDTGDDHGVAFIVMELVDGVTLRSILDQRGPLPIPLAVDIAMQVADALTRAHEQGIIHRDVKPGNVLVQGDGRVKVTDFGIAKSIGSSDLTRDGAVMGTARYLAPEQVGGQAADARADVYALGLVLYEMLAGRTPFDGDSEIATAVARLSAEPTPLRAVRPDVPAGLEQAVHHALARDPADRLPSAAALRTAIEPCLSNDATPAQGVAAVAVRRSRRAWIAAGVVAAGVVAVGVMSIGDVFRDDGREPTPSSTGGPLAIRAIHDFDPEGDGREHPESVALAIDGDPATSWTTERYNTPDFSGDKNGVGLVLDLGRPQIVRSVALDSPDSEWAASIYVADTDAGPLQSWGRARAPSRTLGQQASLTLEPAARGRFVLVWLSRLPPSGRLRISETRVGG